MKHRKSYGILIFVILCTVFFTCFLNFQVATVAYEEGSNNNKDIFYIDEQECFFTKFEYKIAENVTNISGDMYKKDGAWYCFYDEKNIDMVYDKPTQQFWAVGAYADGIEDYVAFYLLDDTNNIWQYCLSHHNDNLVFCDDCIKNGNTLGCGNCIYENDFVHFFYKTNHDSGQIVEADVDRAWLNDYGVAFVRNDKLYAYGWFEFLQKKDLEYDANDPSMLNIVTPKKLFRYKGVKAKKIKTVEMTSQSIYITMQSGRVYKFSPERKSKKKRFEYVHKITKKHLVKKSKNMMVYTDYYYIKENGNAKLYWKQPFSVWQQEIKINDVKEIKYNNRFSYFILKRNGELYGLGDNTYHTISEDDTRAYNSLKLIATDVKEFSVVRDEASVFYLKNNGELYVRGYCDYGKNVR